MGIKIFIYKLTQITFQEITHVINGIYIGTTCVRFLLTVITFLFIDLSFEIIGAGLINISIKAFRYGRVRVINNEVEVSE